MPVVRSRVINNRGALRTLRVRHREFVKDILVPAGSTTNLVVEQIQINPGIDESFPWLSGIASRFESYVFNNLRFEFVPVTGTQNDGAIAICPDYDPADNNVTSPKAKLLQFEDTVRGPLWMNCTATCTTRNLKKRKTFNCRFGPLDSNLDIKTYDTCSICTVVTGVTNSNPDDKVVGELWVGYDVTFMTPQIEPEPMEIAYSSTTQQNADYQPFRNLNLSGELAAQVKSNTELEVFEPGKQLILKTIGVPVTTPYVLNSTQFAMTGDGGTVKELGVSSEPGTNRLLASWLLETASWVSRSSPATFTWPGFARDTGNDDIKDRYLLLAPNTWFDHFLPSSASRRRRKRPNKHDKKQSKKYEDESD